ncbi:MaoC family dehydratase [Peristeroidobacter soli]|jgi:acyl dehydratase|uniref:MaoC family dehydratase n=1 Tax=Peristeroidobacter soli TaxID=2497877 RepID=UPI00101DEFEF|nr:MaoC family dehydratase [Peristeroidobacter soli]
MKIEDLLERERLALGKELGPSRWRDVRQSDIGDFGRCTYDPDPMHVDPEWARTHSPLGGTIAFGFWTLSMTTAMLHELHGGQDGGQYENIDHADLIGINYGCDRLRFIEPVPVGGRIRARATLVSVEAVAVDRLLRSIDVTVEIEHKQRPALVARWLSMTLLPRHSMSLAGLRPTPSNS